MIAYRPEADQFAWTFGGAAPVMRVQPGSVLELWTEDCFAGRVRSRSDLVSVVCQFPFLNPQTGPFYIEGAEPGDTLAVHFISIEPSRDWAASTTVPLFGSLTSTHLTATLQASRQPSTRLYRQLDGYPLARSHGHLLPANGIPRGRRVRIERRLVSSVPCSSWRG